MAKAGPRYRGRVTTHATPTSPARRAARATALTAVLTVVAALTVLSAPAHADVPEGWSEVQKVDRLEALLLLGGGPVLLFLLIMLAVYVPAMKRGETLLPDHGTGEAQWIGGPRQGTKELPAPDGEDSRAGGASGSW
jgi:hypothetical protein